VLLVIDNSFPGHLLHTPFIWVWRISSTNLARTFLAYKIIAFSLRNRLLRTRCKKLLVASGPLEIGGANGKIQKEKEQTEAQPDGA
jgi:hypothetical protein